jgi:hypothetical protein
MKRMSSSQKRAVRNYRSRLSKRGLARFEVLGRAADRDLIRSLARRLAEDGDEASRLRAIVSRTVAGEPPKRGGILAALRRSPLVGADLDLSRPREEGRTIDLRCATSLTVAEIRRGVLDKAAGRRRNQLETWFFGPQGPQALFAGRVLAFDEAAALVWARLMADGKEKDFSGVQLLNPLRPA